MGSTISGAYGMRENLAIFFRYQKRIKIVFFTTLSISLFGSFLVSKVYEADAKILIRHHREAKVVTTSNAPTNTYPTEAQEKLLSEIQIFQSAVVLEKTVNKLNPDVVVEKMRWRWDWLRELPEKIKSSIYRTLWTFEPTNNMLSWLGKKQELPGDNVSKAMAKIADNLEIEPVKGSSVFSVAIEAPDPDFAALVVNTLVEMYQDFHLELRQGTGENNAFAEQVERLKKELQSAKEKFLKLKHEHGIISVSPQIQLLLERMNANQAEMQAMQLNKTETELQVKELERQLVKQPKVIYLENSWIRNPVLNSLSGKLSELELEKNQYVNGSAAMRRVEEEIESIKQRIDKEVSSLQDSNKSGVNPVYQEIQKDLSLGYKKLQGLEKSYVELEKNQQDFARRLEQLDNQKISIHEQEMDIEVKEDALRLYSKKREESEINEILNTKKISDVTPIELAEPAIAAAKPKKIKTIVIGIVVGLAGGLLVAYLSEFFRRSLANKEEVEHFLDYRCLASFRLSEESANAEIDSQNVIQLKLVDEAVRQLNRQKGIQTVLIGSTRAGEGKSKIASELAQSLTEKGSRVLLINDRLRNDQAQIDGTTRQLVGHGKLHSENIFPAEEDDNQLLFSINNADSLSTMIKQHTAGEFESFFDQAKERFDFIIVDAPAFYVVPEVITLASIIDTVIFVVEAETTSRISITKALERLKQADSFVAGIVLNKRAYMIPEWAYDWLLLLNTK